MSTETAGARTYEVRTYGCQMNVHDSERLTGLLEEAGYVAAPGRRAGRRRRLQHLRGPGERRQQALRQPRPPRAGEGEAARACRSPSAAAWRRRTARRSPQKAPWVDVVFGTHNIGSLPVLLERARVQEEAQVEILESLEVFPSTLPTRRESAYAAWVSVSRRLQQHLHVLHRPEPARQGEGPPARRHPRRGRGAGRRGRQRGHPARAERQRVRRGVRRPPGVLGKLLRACGEIDGLERVRFTSPHPAEFTDDVIAAMAETPNVMPQLHMPLQSGSDRVLKAMRRSYRREKYLGIIDRVRAAMPDAAITTDIIVGFPGETEDDFVQTLDVVREARFAAAFTFQYSMRPGTPAATMPDQVPPDVVQERYERLVDVVNEISWAENQALVGSRVELLVAEGEGRKDAATHRLSGRARDNRLVHFAPPADAERPARRRGRRSRSPTPPRTTSSPTARSWPTGVPAPATPGRRAPRPAPSRRRRAGHAHHRRARLPLSRRVRRSRRVGASVTGCTSRSITRDSTAVSRTARVLRRVAGLRARCPSGFCLGLAACSTRRRSRSASPASAVRRGSAVSRSPSVASWPGPVGPTRSLLTPMPPAARSGPPALGLESRSSVSCSCRSCRRVGHAGDSFSARVAVAGGAGVGVLGLGHLVRDVVRRPLVARLESGPARVGGSSSRLVLDGVHASRRSARAGSICGVGCSPRSITMSVLSLHRAVGSARSFRSRTWCSSPVPYPARSRTDTLVRHHRLGQGVEREPVQRRALRRLDDPRLARPRPSGEEEVDPLVDRVGVPGALHRGHEGQVEVVDADLLARPRGGRRRTPSRPARRARRPRPPSGRPCSRCSAAAAAAPRRPARAPSRSRKTYDAGTTRKRSVTQWCRRRPSSPAHVLCLVDLVGVLAVGLVVDQVSAFSMAWSTCRRSRR